MEFIGDTIKGGCVLGEWEDKHINRGLDTLIDNGHKYGHKYIATAGVGALGGMILFTTKLVVWKSSSQDNIVTVASLLSFFLECSSRPLSSCCASGKKPCCNVSTVQRER